jgi:protein TonB
VALPARSQPRFAPPSLARSLAASGLVHGSLIGAGVLLGLIFGGSSDGHEVRAYVARFELGPEEPPFEEPREPLSVTEVDEELPPELVVDAAWQENPVPREEAPEPTRLVHTEWVESLPFLTGEVRPAPDPLPSEPRAVPLPMPFETLPEPPRAPPVLAARPIANPAPAYPRLARRAGEEGSVLCRIHIDPRGRVERVEVVESSGHARLDEAARDRLLTWTFEPRREDGLAVAEVRLHRVTFRLDGG